MRMARRRRCALPAPMMRLAGISVAYRAKPVVRQQATYALNYTALDGVLNWFS